MRKYFIGALCMGVALFSSTSGVAQEDENKVKIDVTITKDGKTENIVKEIEIPDSENLKELMNEIEGLENIDISMEEGDIEIVVKRKGEDNIFTSKNFKFPSNFEFHTLGDGEDRAFMGIIGNDNNGEVELSKIIEGEAAERAGFKSGDIVKKFDGETVEDYNSLVDMIRAKKPGDKVEVKIERDGKSKKLNLELGNRKDRNIFYSTESVIDWDGDKDFMKLHLDKLGADSERGFLGIHFMMSEDGGVPITKIVGDSPAEKADLQSEDVIIKVNGKRVEDGSSFNDLMKDMKPGDKLELTIDRDGEKIEKTVELGERSSIFHVEKRFNGNNFNHNYNFNFDNENVDFSFDDNVIVKIRVAKVTDEEKEMLNEALGLKSSTGFDDINLEVYPNPTEGKFSVEAKVEDIKDLEMSVFDLKGTRIGEAKVSSDSGEFETEFDISDYPAGNYFLVLKNGSKTFTEKLVKR